MSASLQKILERTLALSLSGEPFVICTLLASRGHAPQEPGAKAIITRAGLVEGTIGGGRLEARAIVEARQILERGHDGPLVVDWDLQMDIGMSCGGSVRLLWETYGSRVWNIVVFGAGHVSQALTRVLAILNCRVVCVDPRAEWIERLPDAPRLKSLVVDDMASFAREVPSGSFCVVVTMGHRTDLPILEQLLIRTDLPFVGSIGSAVKARTMKADLKRAGLTAEQIAQLHCPIGVLGSRAPEEIAISISAQLIQQRDARPVAQVERHRRQGFGAAAIPQAGPR